MLIVVEGHLGGCIQKGRKGIQLLDGIISDGSNEKLTIEENEMECIHQSWCNSEMISW